MRDMKQGWKWWLATICCLLFVLSACQLQQQKMGSETEDVSTRVLPSPTVTATVGVSATATVGATATVTKTPTEPAMQTQGIERVHPQVLTTLPPETKLTGRLILYQSPQYKYVDAGTGRALGNYPVNFIPDMRVGGGTISPNKEWVYWGQVDVCKRCCEHMVISTSLEKPEIICLDAVWPAYASAYWVNDELLHVQWGNHDDDGPDRDWLLNPFTKEIQEIGTGEYPAMDDGESSFYGYGRDKFIQFSPDLKRVVYLRQDKKLVWWDTEHQIVLAERPSNRYTIINAMSIDTWSADIQRWLSIQMVPQEDGWLYELVLTDRDGNLLAETQAQFDNIYRAFWSPNEEKVAFIYLEAGEERFAIWDLKTGKVSEYYFEEFMPKTDITKWAFYYEDIFWSPDSRYVAVQVCPNGWFVEGKIVCTIWLFNPEAGWVVPWFVGDVRLSAWYEPAP